MDITIKGDFTDFLDEDEVREIVLEQIKEETKNILYKDDSIKNIIVQKVFDEVNKTYPVFSDNIKQTLNKRIQEVILKEYISDDFSMRYHLKMDERVNEIYENNKEDFNIKISNAIEKTLSDYKVDDYILSNIAKDIILQNKDCVEKLEELFVNRIDDILEKI